MAIAGVGYAARKFDPTNAKIVINKSIGKVKLGGSGKGAEKLWKGDLTCDRRVDGGEFTKCYTREGPKSTGYVAFMYTIADDKIVQVGVGARAIAGKLAYKKPWTTLKTSKGIGVGSKKTAARKAHPGGSNDSNGRYVVKKGKDSTAFTFDNNRVGSIAVEREIR